MNRFVLFAALCLSITSCSPVVSWHGNKPPTGAVESLEVGKDTTRQVLEKLGPPTSVAPLNQPQWYYINYSMEKYYVKDPKPKGEHVIIVNFDPKTGILTNVDDKSVDRTYVPIDPTVTPAYGTNRTVLQEILGNIGKFNPAGNNKIGTN